jgi:hypothetical protein
MEKGIFNQLLDNLEGRAQPEIPVAGRDKERVCGVFLHVLVDAELSAGCE